MRDIPHSPLLLSDDGTKIEGIKHPDGSESTLARFGPNGELLGADGVASFAFVSSSGSNASAALNAALASGVKIVDGRNLTYTINSAITVPSGVELRNIKLQAGTVGMNMVLFNSFSRMINVSCRGTGAVSTVERAFYPAVDGVFGATLDVEVENITVGVHLAPLTSVQPSFNTVRVYAHDIVGTTGASEGYGCLVVNSVNNQIDVRAKNIKRHALYLSAGASHNRCNAFVDTCYHHAVSVYSIAGQPSCADNEIRVKAINLSNAATQTGLSVALGITQKCDRNRAVVDCESSGSTDHAVRIEGVGNVSGPWPTDNVVEVNATGTYLGNAVVFSGDCDNTIFVNPVVNGKAANALLQFYDSSGNTYTPKRAGAVYGGLLDGVDNTMTGVANSAARGAVEITGHIAFARLNPSGRVVDYTGTRTGVNRTHFKSVQVTSVATGTSATATVTLPFALENISARLQVTAASTSSDAIVPVVTAMTSTTVTIAVWNRSGSTQASITVGVWVTGD